MNEKLTHIEVVVDRSGSMAAIADDVIGGYNGFVAAQKGGVGEATLSYSQFDTEFETIYDAVPIDAVPPLTDATFQPRGMTALFDAVGDRILKCGDRLAAMPEADRPGKVLFLIITDGLENSSCEFTRERIREMIETQEKLFSWTFAFIGANQDAFAEGGRIGVRRDRALNYAADSRGVARMFECCEMAVGRLRGATPSEAGSRPFFTAEEQDEAEPSAGSTARAGREES